MASKITIKDGPTVKVPGLKFVKPEQADKMVAAIQKITKESAS